MVPRRAVAVLLLAAACGGGANVGEDSAPRAPAPPQPGAASTVAVCSDPPTHRCFMARSADDCGPPPAAFFKLVPNDPSRPDVADALAACRDTLRP